MISMVLSYNGRVNIAVNKVLEKFPDAKLIEVHGSSSSGPVTDPSRIDQLEVVFFNDSQSHIKIQSTDYADFGEPELLPGMWMESVIIDWPIDMDINEAHMLKERARFTDAYTNVTLRQILHPKYTHPCFIFDASVFVDTVTKNVFK